MPGGAGGASISGIGAVLLALGHWRCGGAGRRPSLALEVLVVLPFLALVALVASQVEQVVRPLVALRACRAVPVGLPLRA